MTERPSIAIGVMAHNEERNIGRLLERLCAMELPNARDVRIVVVASGCTDGTAGIAERAAQNGSNPSNCREMGPAEYLELLRGL